MADAMQGQHDDFVDTLGFDPSQHDSGLSRYHGESYTPSREDYLIGGALLFILSPMALNTAYTAFKVPIPLSQWLAWCMLGMALAMSLLAIDMVIRKVTIYKDRIETRGLLGRKRLKGSEIRGYKKHYYKPGYFYKIYPNDKKLRAITVANDAVKDALFEDWLFEFRDLNLPESKYYSQGKI